MHLQNGKNLKKGGRKGKIGLDEAENRMTSFSVENGISILPISGREGELASSSEKGKGAINRFRQRLGMKSDQWIPPFPCNMCP